MVNKKQNISKKKFGLEKLNEKHFIELFIQKNEFKR
jgi:hypothetical protein